MFAATPSRLNPKLESSVRILNESRSPSGLNGLSGGMLNAGFPEKNIGKIILINCVYKKLELELHHRKITVFISNQLHELEFDTLVVV